MNFSFSFRHFRVLSTSISWPWLTMSNDRRPIRPRIPIRETPSMTGPGL